MGVFGASRGASSIAGCSFLTVVTGRVLRHPRRAMPDEHEWRRAQTQLCGDFDHLLVVSTLPVLVSPALHYLDARTRRCATARGGNLAARIGEKIRRAIDLQHWAAFQDSFHRLFPLEELASGSAGASSGLNRPARRRHPPGVRGRGRVPRCGRRDKPRLGGLLPVPAPTLKARTERSGSQRSRALRRLTQRMAHAAGVRDPTVRWRAFQEPTLDNQVAWVRLDGPRLSLTIERLRPGDGPELEATFERRLA